MALPTSKNELIDYAKRELGSPVINIEMDDDQVSDRVDYMLQKFIDRHYDGQTEEYVLIPVYKTDYINGYLTLPEATRAVTSILRSDGSSSIEPFDSIEYYTMWDYTFGYGAGTGTMSHYTITMQHLALINFIMGSGNLFTFNSISKRMYFHDPLPYISSGNLFGNSYNVIADDTVWDKTNCVATDFDKEIPDGSLDASTITSSAAGIFGIKGTQETDSYIRGIFSTEIILMAGTYTGDIDIIFEDRNGTVVDTTTVSLTNQWEKHDFSAKYISGINDVVVRFETSAAAAAPGETFFVWAPSLYVNNLVAVHLHRALNVEEVDNVWKQEWILKYTTQLVKQQWGHNTKKYQGVQLPGGIETTGQTLFDEATDALLRLDEEFSLEYELPVDFFMG